MKGWKLLDEEAAGEIWNANLAVISGSTPFQTFEWGQFHKALGWEPVHFVFTEASGKTGAMMLGLLRRFPLRTGFLWCVGGPVGNFQAFDADFPKTILSAIGLKRLYFRFHADRERNIRDVLFLNQNGWSRSIFPMTSSFSMELDISENAEAVLAKFSGKWRRNLRLAEKNGVVIKQCLNPEIEDLRRIFAEMEKLKKLSELFSAEKLKNLFQQNRQNLIFYAAEDASGNLLGFRGALLNGKKACDYLAANSERGRALRVSYPLLWQTILECRRRGVVHYDLGGIDPAANPGVYTFKKETNAREVEFLGEWDWASSTALRLLGNWLIRKRQNGGKGKLMSFVKGIRKIAAGRGGNFKSAVPPLLKINRKSRQNSDFTK